MWSSLRLSLSWMWAGVGHPMSVRQSCRVLSDSPHSCVHIPCVLPHCTSISSATLCEENTRCWVWSLILATRCHGNTNQTAACTGGGRQEVREQGGMNGQGSTQARCQSNRRMWRNSFRLGDARTCSKVLQGATRWASNDCNLSKWKWQEKVTCRLWECKSYEATEKKGWPATCCTICQEKKSLN